MSMPCAQELLNLSKSSLSALEFDVILLPQGIVILTTSNSSILGSSGKLSLAL